MERARIICVVGPSCAGKTTASRILSSLTGYRCISASSYPRSRFLHSGSNLDLLQFVINEFGQKGRDTFAKELVLDLKRELVTNDKKGCIVDGFRAVEEVKLLSREIGLDRVIAIYTDDRERFKRNSSRSERDKIEDYEKFVRKDIIEYSFGVASLMIDHSDAFILNEGSLRDFEVEIKKLVSRFGLN